MLKKTNISHSECVFLSEVYSSHRTVMFTCRGTQVGKVECCSLEYKSLAQWILHEPCSIILPSPSLFLQLGSLFCFIFSHSKFTTFPIQKDVFTLETNRIQLTTEWKLYGPLLSTAVFSICQSLPLSLF